MNTWVTIASYVPSVMANVICVLAFLSRGDKAGLLSLFLILPVAVLSIGGSFALNATGQHWLAWNVLPMVMVILVALLFR